MDRIAEPFITQDSISDRFSPSAINAIAFIAEGVLFHGFVYILWVSFVTLVHLRLLGHLGPFKHSDQSASLLFSELET